MKRLNWQLVYSMGLIFTEKCWLFIDCLKTSLLEIVDYPFLREIQRLHHCLGYLLINPSLQKSVSHHKGPFSSFNCYVSVGIMVQIGKVGVDI